MKRLVPMYDNSGARYSIPEDRVDEFRADMGEVAEARRYRGKDGQHYTIPQDQDEAFRADMPDAVPVRSYTMADGSRRDFTMSEMSKFLRSKEYRESEDYTPPQTGSVAGAAVKGALGGAAEGAYYGGKNALAKVVTALPEAAASVGEAAGNVINLGGNTKNAVGDWLRASGQQTKRWLGENIRGDQYDENGNLVMSGLTKDLGYEDTLTKIGETAGDAAAMAVKFAAAAVAGPAYMETILASDGINAFADTFDRAKAAGYSDAEANLAGAASGLINYYGAKLMMKGGAATKDIANPLLRALGGTAFTGAATAAQAVGNKGVENVIEGKPITEGMLGAAGEGFVEGAQFHLINEVGTNAKASMQIRRETREMKEMRKENLLTAAETPDGRAFLNTVVQNEGVDAAIRARKDGKDVSRKMGAAADLPDNMSAAERNAVIDGISKAREAQAERVRTKMDDVQAQSLADEIGQNLMGGATDPMFEDIWLNATRRVKNAAELDEPGARARIVGEAIEDVVGKQLDAGPANRTDTPLEKKIAQNRSRIGQEQKAKRRAEMDEYERQEKERIARENAEEAAAPTVDEERAAQEAEQAKARAEVENAPEEPSPRESSEYRTWLKKRMRTDTDKNWNRFVAERGLDPSLKVDRGRNATEKPTPPELRVEKPKKPVIEADLTEKPQNPSEVDKKTTENAEIVPEKPVKTPEKPQSRQSDENGPTGAPQEKGTMSQANGAEGRETQNGASGKAIREKVKSEPHFYGEKALSLDDAQLEELERLQNDYSSKLQVRDRDSSPENEKAFRDARKKLYDFERKHNGSVRPVYVGGDFAESDAGGGDAHAANVTKAAEIIAGVSAKQTGNTKWHTPENHRKGAEALVNAIENKDADALRTRFNGLNKGYVKAFEAITGLKMPNTQKGQHDVVDRFCGITPEKRAEINAKRKADAEAKAEAERRERSLKQGQEAVAKYRVQTPDGKITTLDKLIEQGWTVKKVRRGSVDVPRVIPPDGNGYFKAPAGSYEYLKDLADKHAAAKPKPSIRVPDGNVGANGDVVSAKPKTYEEIARRLDELTEAAKPKNGQKGDVVAGNRAEGYKAVASALGYGYSPKKRILKSQLEQIAKELRANEQHFDNRNSEMNKLYAARREGNLEAVKDAGLEVYTDENGLTQVRKAKAVKSTSVRVPDGKGRMVTKPAPVSKTETTTPADPEKTISDESAKGIGIFAPAKPKESDGSKVAKLAEKYVADEKDTPGRESLRSVFHTPEGKVVATNGRILIETTHGHDKAIADEQDKATRKFPNYKQVMPEDKNLTQSVEVNPAELANALKEAKKTARASGVPLEAVLKVGTKVYKFNGDHLRLMAETMDAEGITTIKTTDAVGPVVAYGKNTKIVLMPLRVTGDKPFNELIKESGTVTISGHSGKYLSLPKADSAEATKKIADLREKIEANKTNPKLRSKYEKELAKIERATNAVNEAEQMRLDDALADKFLSGKSGILAEKSTSTPADRTSDPAIVEWAKKRGLSVVTGANGKAKVSEETVRRFNADQIGKAVNATKNLIKGVKVETVGREWSESLDNPDGADNSVKLKREGRVVGTYDPASKKVRLYSGADASTVYHELIGHAVHDWAKDNSKPLYNKLNRLASEAPKELVDEIRRNYPDADEATIAKEIIAHIAGKKGVENITPKLKDKPSTWYAKAYVAVRDAILDFMQKIGFRRIDVKKMESMTPMEAMDYLTEQAAKGRMLGKADATDVGALTKYERWATNFYDRKAALEPVSKDAADAKALQPGKEYDFQLRNFDVKKRDFGKILADNDIAEESVADYMRAQSAPERNRRLREEFLEARKGGDPSDYELWVQNNGGSGWSDERAAEHMKFFNSLPKERQDAIKKAADFLWKMQKEGMERRVKAGLISREDADALMAAEQYHIPWKSAISEFDGEWHPWRGKNNFKAGEFAKAKGRATEAGDPIAWMFEEFSDAHLRAIENDTRAILARDIEASGKFGKVIQNTPQNQMKELRVKGGDGQANVVNFKRDGNTYSIVIDGERGDAIASAYTNRDLAHMPKKVQAFMRWWSATATEWSPTFAVRNLIADNLDVARIVLAEQGVKQGAKTLGKYAANRQRIAKEMLHYARTGEMVKGGVLERYSKEGGMIGGFQRQGYENLREQMSYENIRKQFEKDAKKGRSRTKSVLSLVPKAFDGIKMLNTYAELSSRVAMFKTNVDAGMSAKDAAIYSRRITVDFNRKGNYTPVLNTLFMFSNSTIGATMRQIEAVHKGWKTPQGKRALALLFLQGLATAGAEAFINMDDDENEKLGKGTWKDMPEHNYTSRLGIRVGDKFYGLPGHDDPLSRISWLGSSIGRMFFGKMKPSDFGKEMGSFGADMAGRFAGKGSTDIASGWNVLAPSALQWFVQALENKDFAGRPIQRPKFDDAKPWSQNGRASTPQSYKTVAEVLNEISGGNEARPGKLDYSPEMIRHVFNSVFKNVGRDAGDLISMAEVGLRIADFDIRNAPIARNLVTKSNGNDNRFFEARKAFDSDKNEFDKRTSWEPGERKQYIDEHPWLRKGADNKRTVDRLVNMTNRDNPRSGIKSMGITQLRKLTEGKVRRKDGTYFEPNTPISDELKEKAREMLQKRQARVIEIMGM